MIKMKNKSIKIVDIKKSQLDNCRKKNKETFQKIKDEILIEIILKNTSRTERISVETIDDIYNEIKDREIKEFRIL